MPLIQVFIATYNRPSLVLNAINSALNQEFGSFEVIVSDNSTNNETEILVSQIENKRLTYKRRIPSLTANDHFNTILQEVRSEYFLIFHDDDIMHKNMLYEQYDAFVKNKNIVAVGTNALIVSNNRNNKKLIYRITKNDKILSSPIDIIYHYSTYGGIVPFPSYMYRLEVAKIKFELSKGGKYCDAAFIMDILNLGNILYLVKPLMDYYIHKGQDSMSYSFEQESKLIRYFCFVSGLNRNNKLIKKLRLNSIYIVLKQGLINNNIKIFSKRYFKLLGIIIKSYHFNYTIKSLVLTTLKFTKRK